MWKYSSYSKIEPEAQKHFPFENPRPGQLEAISEIKSAIDKGFKYIVLEAGTGTGKSAIAATLSSMYESSYILTVTKQLQNQYLNDFESFTLVKGRGNFTCRQYQGHTCDEGKCIAEGFSCEDSQKTCDYYLQKNLALNSKTVISNYHYMFLELNYVGDFTVRELLICDEAHNLENVLMSQLKLEFNMADLKKYLKVDITDEILYQLDNGDFDVWIQFIGEIRDEYIREYEKIKYVKKPHLAEKVTFIKNQIGECSRFIKNVTYDPYSWIFNYNSNLDVLEFKPLKIDRYAHALFDFADVCIFMSATILDYKFFCKCLGIGEDEVYAIRQKSPFDLKRNPIKTYDGFNMSHKTIGHDAIKTIAAVESILESHKNEKGIIHTVSGSCKDFLMENIDSKRLLDHNTKNRSEQLEKFKKSSKPLVLVSPSMNEGVDLPGNLCRFQIIYKIPYPDLADKQIRLRANASEKWYDYKTCLALIQTHGRGMRYEDDYCMTYFIDSRIKEFVERDRNTNNFLPNAFRDSID